MARVRRTIIFKLLFLTASIFVSSLFFLAILKNVKFYPVIKQSSTDIFYLKLKKNAQSNSVAVLSADMNSQPDQSDKSNDSPIERTYFTPDSLSEKPFILQDIDPNLFEIIEYASLEKLILRLLINEYGDVEKVIIEEAKLSDALLPVFEYAFLQTKFSPGRINGRAVPSTLRIEVKIE